jgi:signal transduction histidine kinase
MKLSVQHLQRAWKDKKGDMEETMQRFSNTLVEQIDTLSNIATEFSNFAKMPGATFAPVNISSALKNSATLYSENENVTLKQYDFTKGTIEVYADKDQLVRVFSNLLKNAVQAIPPDRKGQILVKITHDENNCMISIADNGTGIPEDKIPQIFTPNFTTKTGGTGLGLAMVKNIVENSNGHIWFETESGKGTTFYITLPVYKGMGIA